jgi:hypothetical protein
MEPKNHQKRSPATQRAIARVRAGERPTYAAREEKIDNSTLFRALAKDRPQRLFLTIEPLADGFNIRVENQRSRRVSKDYRYATLADLQSVLPQFFAWMKTKLQR